MGTVAKALDLLDLFTRQRPQIGLSDAARLSGMNKATCYRLLTELAEFGLVEQLGATRDYRLGPAVLRLAALREATVPMRDAALPVLQSLALATGETAHISMLSGGRLSTLAFAYSPEHGMKVMMEDADTLPYHATSSGHAVLAYMPEAEREVILSRPLPALTDGTPTDANALRKALGQIRSTGLAEVSGTYERDVQSMAVPLFDATGTVVGALAVAAPVQRMTADLRARIARHLTRSATEIITLWGGSPPPDLTQIWRAVA